METDRSEHPFSWNIHWRLLVPILLCLSLSPSTLYLNAKEPSLTAIIVYQNGSAWMYLQASDVLLNAKTEVRNCDGVPEIDKSTYSKLPKFRLSAPASLEVLDNGSLRYTKDNSSTCVVPDNVKFEKGGSFTPGQLASRSAFEGKPIGSATVLPPCKPGLLIVFVTAPDDEFAQFLLASRASQIPFWEDYLAKYPSTAHTKEAKLAFAQLLVTQSRAHLGLYNSSESLSTPAFPELQTAMQLASKASSILPTDLEVKAINAEVGSAIDDLAKKGNAELQKYQLALSNKSTGYDYLRTANHLLEELEKIDLQNPSVLKFEADTRTATDSYESAIRSSQNLISSNRVDEAMKAVSPYLSFLSEDPRVAAIASFAYSFHFNKGKTLGASGNWEEASKEFELANKIKPSPEAVSALAEAKNEAEKARNRAAADAARQQSKEYAGQRDFIAAYEVLANLPPNQRSLVDSDIADLGPFYVKSASQTAQQLQKAHDPIRGLVDEKEIEKAYGYLDRAYSIDGQPSLKERRDDLGDKLSEYYLQQARRYIAKPLGSGVCIGQSYLDKALPYKASNLESLREEITKTSPTYQMRSSLSIRVEFRDQTSRRDSIGFAEQLGDAIATGLENSGLPVRIIRPGENPVVDANFRLVGDVNEHRKNTSTDSESKDSNYRAGEEQFPNPQWNAANREYEAAKLELESARSIAQGATARGNKKGIAAAQEKVNAGEQKVKSALEKLDSIAQISVRDTIRPYSYTEKRMQYSATVDLGYRIIDSSGQTIETSEPISRSNTRTVTILENVKPEDTENVKMQGNVLDENEFLIDVENRARDALIKAARASVQKLPDKIFINAKLKEKDGDFDAAGEYYILYLNSIPAASSPNRIQAESFLFQQFNIRRKYGTSF